MDERLKSRLRLWLRSERALGLTAVEAPGISAIPTASLATATPQAEAPQRTPVQSPAQAPRVAAQSSEVEEVAPPPDSGLMAPPASEAFAAHLLSRQQKIDALAAMNDNEVRGCTKCRLCEQRTQTVFGEGDADARLFFIGEGPGETEDRTGRPFVGRAGELLNKMIGAMGLSREQVFIANIVKCRPPNNRVPAPDEVATCTPYLERQLEIVRPKAIVTLGLPASKYMLQVNSTMGKLRGRWHTWRGIPLMPTFHPAYILRNDTRETKAMVWSDLKMVMSELGLQAPKPRGQS